VSTFDPDPQTGKSWAITYEQYLAENEDHLRELLETLAKDEDGFFPKCWYPATTSVIQGAKMVRLACCPARPGKQSVSPRSAGHRYSAHLAPLEREHYGNVLHQDAADDVKSAMAKLESSIPAAPEATAALTDTYRTLKENPITVSTAVN